MPGLRTWRGAELQKELVGGGASLELECEMEFSGGRLAGGAFGSRTCGREGKEDSKEGAGTVLLEGM